MKLFQPQSLTMERTNAIDRGPLPLMEHFYTIQGEGFNTGKSAYFLRLGGCDVGCVWCDVKDSWDATAHERTTINDMAIMVIRAHASRVVITGGEPLMYNLQALCAELKAHGCEVFVETSGAYPMSGTWDWICVSPKKFKAPLPEVLIQAHELKVVVFNQSDFAWAEKHAAMVNADCKLYLQPEHGKMAEMMPAIIDYVKQHPKWTISLQTHKIIQVP